MMLSWMGDPSVQIRGKPATNQPLKQGYIVTSLNGIFRLIISKLQTEGATVAKTIFPKF
jgi:hypothetical protein